MIFFFIDYFFQYLISEFKWLAPIMTFFVLVLIAMLIIESISEKFDEFKGICDPICNFLRFTMRPIYLFLINIAIIIIVILLSNFLCIPDMPEIYFVYSIILFTIFFCFIQLVKDWNVHVNNNAYYRKLKNEKSKNYIKLIDQRIEKLRYTIDIYFKSLFTIILFFISNIVIPYFEYKEQIFLCILFLIIFIASKILINKNKLKYAYDDKETYIYMINHNNEKSSDVENILKNKI